MTMMLTRAAAPRPARRGVGVCVVAALSGLLLAACTPAAAAVTGQQPHGLAAAEPCIIATDNHLWVFLFVDSNYGQGANERRNNFWTNAAMKQEFVEVWQFLANRYRHTPYMTVDPNVIYAGNYFILSPAAPRSAVCGE